jgi:hypothetical protein
VSGPLFVFVLVMYMICIMSKTYIELYLGL